MVQLARARQRSATSCQRGCSRFARSNSLSPLLSMVRPVIERVCLVTCFALSSSSGKAFRAGNLSRTSFPASIPDRGSQHRVSSVPNNPEQRVHPRRSPDPALGLTDICLCLCGVDIAHANSPLSRCSFRYPLPNYTILYFAPSSYREKPYSCYRGFPYPPSGNPL